MHVCEAISISLRIKFLLTGVVFPFVCVVFVLSDIGQAAVEEPWQSGDARDYAAMLLRWPAIGPLLPAVAFCAACLSCWTLRPNTGAMFAVRLGIYSGIPVAALFWWLIVLTSDAMTVFATCFVGPALAIGVYGLKLLARRARRFAILHLLVFTSICAVVVAVAKALDANSFLEFLLICFLFVLAATPTLNLVTYVRATVLVARQADELPRRYWLVSAGGWLTWLIGFAATTRQAVVLMLDEYAKLPTTDPNCYVTSAAIHRHLWLVPEAIDADEPPTRRVSAQTKRLKFLELLLIVCVPRIHRVLRACYDRIGPRLASICAANRWLADATYCLLAPLELIAEGLRTALGIRQSKVMSLYSAKLEESADSLVAHSLGIHTDVERS